MRENKGITLVSLSIMIIILIILTSIAMYSGQDSIQYAKFEKAKSQMETINSKVNTLYTQYKNGDNTILDYGLNTTECDQQLLTKTFEDGNVDLTKRNRYKYFSKDWIKDDLDLGGISYDFLVNVQDREILLLGGINYNKKEYYTLKDFGIKNVEHQE